MDDPALNHQRLVLEAVVETVPNGILVIDEERNFFTYNQNFIDMWQIPDDVVEAGSDQQALKSVLEELEQPDEFLETVEYFYEHPEEVGRDVIHLADGRIFERYTAPARDEDGTYQDASGCSRILPTGDSTNRSCSGRMTVSKSLSVSSLTICEILSTSQWRGLS